MSKHLTLIVVFVTTSFMGCASTVRIPEHDTPPKISSDNQKSLSIQYLGVGGQRLEYNGEVVLTGPMFTNPSFILSGPFIPLHSDHQKVDQYMPDSAQAEIMLIGHAHYDHLIDVAYIMEKHAPKAHLYGSLTTVNTVAGFVPAERMTAVNEFMGSREKIGNWFYSNSGKVRIMPLKSSHAPHFMGIKLMQGKYSKPLDTLPWHAFAWREGQTLAFIIDFLDDHNLPAYRVFYQDSASEEKLGVAPDLGDGKGFDVAIICPASFEQIDHYPESIIANTQAKHYMLGHWEDFFGNNLHGEQHFVRNTNQDKFIRRLNAALPEYSHWTRPNLFQTYHFNSQGLINHNDS